MRNSLLLYSLFLVLTGCSPAPPREQAAQPKRPARAPDNFQVRFETSKGPFTIEVDRAWAPRGADRFYELVEDRFFDEARFFRVVKGFVVQFGIHKDPVINARWNKLHLVDDPVRESNKRGYVSYATSGPSTRTTQIFINLADNSRLDSRGFAPFGRVTDGMDVVDKLYAGYGDSPPLGYYGPDQNKIEAEGNAYLERSFSRLDYIRTARVVSH
ncbi:MAG TPA: peptidylprolyl isomerase [Bryobacteraceae bacterium]|nr:peptidylprolyl isomerase [Bryobacteraceae bacterium]